MLIQKLGITRQSVKLSDNVDFVYFERPGTPLHLQVLFNYGARHVSSEKSGLAHFTEHMLLV